MKVIKKHIKKAILIYEDPDLGENRRIIFGEENEVNNLLISEIPIIFERLGKISKKKFKNPKDMIDWYIKQNEDWNKVHQIKASKNNDMEMDLSYEVKNL